ncbi:MAG: F0F1 ATP synthase subunit A [Chloroflexota bacterium]
MAAVDEDGIEMLGEATSPTRKGSSTLRKLLLLLVAVIVIDILAIIFVPPFDKENPSGECAYPICFINGNLELPAPHVVWAPGGVDSVPHDQMLMFNVSLTNTLVTMILITIVLLVAMIIASRKREAIPGRVQNFIEWSYESLHGFASSMGGPAAKPYIPLFASFFILILAFNWSGLIPPIGKVEELRAPTSDLNVTIGLALVAFFTFHVQGVRQLGWGGYFGKFFPFYEFKQGIGAGIIALFVGLIELLLEFVKPLTLSMRLFGNIYGGEVALGVLTALTVALLPVALYGLEIMLTLVQALIFSTLTLMFILAAIESHHHEEGEIGHEAASAANDAGFTHHAPSAAH